MLHIPAPLAPLARFRQFIVYRLVPRTDKPGKTDKFPVSCSTGIVVSAHDPAEWVDAETAVRVAATFGSGYGVGFVFTDADPFWFLDIDGAAIGGAWSPLALQLLQALNGAAVEVSQSRTGLHIIGSGKSPEHACKNTALHLEFYTSGRFVALTGTHAYGTADADLSPVLPWLVETYFPARETVRGTEWTTAPVAEWSGPADDNALIARAMSAQSAASVFGNRASFADLFNANAEALGRAYPDNFGGRAYDASSADAALAQHLAFWTGNDCERIARIMQRSALKRDKWTAHKSYIHMTVTRAVSMQSRVYQGKTAEPMPESVAPGAVMPTAVDGLEFAQGLQFLAPTQQVEHFAGCVYVRELHRIYTPSGDLLNPERFRATYGGYLFALDSANSKTSKNAWEVFTESQAIRFPKVQATCFRPQLSPGQIVTEEGRTIVNVFHPIQTKRAKGDPAKFITHLTKVLPDPTDQVILLSYMAACVQHKGVKFQWAPLLQGTEGNGKTLFTRCVAYAVGKRYTHYPKASDIDNKFNGWLINKLFVGVEDIYVPDHRREVIETLKPMITGGDGLEVQLKGVDQVTADICANFMLNSNHKDALKSTRNDRRFAVFFTAQQSVEDLTRDGMTGDYFPDLYEWLRGDGRYEGQTPGYAVVNDFLSAFTIPVQYNPAGACHRAPRTSSTDEALSLAMGTVEQEVAEAIDEGRPGFAGGWVSSMALDKLLEALRLSRAIPPNKRRELMQGMGYEWHPHLPNGRVNNPIPLDGGKPRLFIRSGHIAANLTGVAEIARAYVDAQTATAPTSVPKAVAIFGGNPPTNGH